MSEKRIAIIGSGVGGLALAYYLKKRKGISIDIFESSEKIGGLAKTIDIEGQKLEQFYHHIFTTDTSIIDLITELGLKERLKWYDDNTAIYYNNKLFSFKGPIDLLRFSPLSLFNRFRMGAVLFYLTKTKNWKKLEKETAVKWMIKHAGQKGYDAIWGPLLFGKFQQRAKDITMSWLWARVATRANSNGKLGYMDGSFDIFLETLAQAVQKQNTSIHTGVKIQRIERRNTTNFLQYETKEKKIIEREFDEIIITTPAKVYTTFLKGLSNRYIKRVNAIEYLSAQTIILTLKEQLTPFYWISVNDIKAPALAVIEQSNLINVYNEKHVLYIGNYLQNDDKVLTMDENALKNKYYPFLKKLNPAFTSEWVEDFKVCRAPFAQPIVDTNYFKHLPAHESPIKNIFILNMSQVYPEDRGMNFAIRNALTLLDKM